MNETLSAFASYDSPVGHLRLEASGDFLVALHWSAKGQAEDPSLLPNIAVLQEALAQLSAYFAKDLKVFDLPFAPKGTTFQTSLWQALAEIPYGSVMEYGALVAKVGGTARSIGTACGANPLPIFLPCHRVVGKGHFGGFSGHGGLDSKRWLLVHEGALLL